MKFLKHAFLAITISTLFFGNAVFAATTVLPSSEDVNKMTEQECIKYIKEYGDFETAFKTGTSEFQDMGFGCAIKSAT